MWVVTALETILSHSLLGQMMYRAELQRHVRERGPVRRRERIRYADPKRRFADTERSNASVSGSGVVVGTYAV
jgi:hypothetical protein